MSNEKINAIFESYKSSFATLMSFVVENHKNINDDIRYFSETLEKFKPVDPDFLVKIDGKEQHGFHEETMEKCIVIPIEEYSKMKKFLKHSEEMKNQYPNIFLKMSIIYMHSIYEAFISDILCEILYLEPKILKSNKQISFDQIIDLNSNDNLIDYMINREISEFGYKSIEDQIHWIRNKLNIDLCASGESIDFLVESKATRNIIVHNNGVINDFYLYAVKNTKYSRKDRISLTYEGTLDNFNRLNTVAIYFYNSIMEKFFR